MNWGYIFFKYEDDASKYMAENEDTTLTSYTEVRQQALERRKAKMKAGTNVDAHDSHDGHVHGEGEQTHMESKSEGHGA